MEPAPLLFVEATTGEESGRLPSSRVTASSATSSRVDGEYAYVAGRFKALTATFSDPSLERLNERIVAGRPR